MDRAREGDMRYMPYYTKPCLEERSAAVRFFGEYLLKDIEDEVHIYNVNCQ